MHASLTKWVKVHQLLLYGRQLSSTRSAHSLSPACQNAHSLKLLCHTTMPSYAGTCMSRLRHACDARRRSTVHSMIEWTAACHWMAGASRAPSAHHALTCGNAATVEG
jgi:hypothetical protein